MLYLSRIRCKAKPSGMITFKSASQRRKAYLSQKPREVSIWPTSLVTLCEWLKKERIVAVPGESSITLIK